MLAAKYVDGDRSIWRFREARLKKHHEKLERIRMGGSTIDNYLPEIFSTRRKPPDIKEYGNLH